MKQALARACVLILVLGLLISGAVSMLVFDQRLTQEKEQALTGLATLLAELYDPAGDANEQAGTFATYSGTRVTILAADGTVKGDSQADFRTMENHGDREEVKAAAQGGQAVAIRVSSTLNMKMMYAAIQTESGDYIRLAQSYGGAVADLLSVLPGMLLAAVLALAVSGIVAGQIVSGVTGPLRDMNESLSGVKDGTAMLDAGSYPYEELQDMAAKINVIAAEVSASIGQLRAAKERTDFLLDNMSEGFLLLDEDRRVQIINQSACRLFSCDKTVQGGPLAAVTRDEAIRQGLEDIRSSGQSCQTELERQSRIFEVRFTDVGGEKENEPGLIITLTDVTESRQAARMRQEFFSNAGHELKTPLTAIRGNAELLCSDLPMDDDTRRELLGRIGRETDRMTTVIEDIIMLSRIESHRFEEELEPLDFQEIILSCVDETAPLARQNQVTVRLDTKPVNLVACRAYVYQLVDNLLTNAVKYNRPGGAADLALAVKDGAVVFSVRNDGEPIPLESQSRVFERFYRVDKGRSRAAGGTGLGLSIVKHVVDAMNGTVELTSTAAEGTRVTVTLPI